MRRVRLPGLPILLPVLLGGLVYLNALGGSFHFDDAHAVEENPFIRTLSSLGRFFVDPGTFSVLPQNQNYRPLLLATYALTAAVTGVDARAFLAVNLLVHLACVALVQRLLVRALRLLGHAEDPLLAGLAAAIFAVHPLFSECVNYVSARSESLCAAFSLGAMVAYLRGREEGRARWLAVSALSMIAAALVKAVTFPVPLALLALEVAAPAQQGPGQVARRIAWVLAPALAGLALVGWMTPPLAIRSASTYSRLDYFRSELPAILHYPALFAWPAGQSADADYPAAASFLEPRVALAALALAVAAAFAVQALLRRQQAGPAVAVAWFLVFILPSSSVFPLAELVNEHRPYLAAAAFCPLLAALLLRGPGRLLALEGERARRAGIAAACAALAVLSALTVARNRVWRTEESLWADVVQGSPLSSRGRMNYGLALMRRGALSEAAPQLREAVRLAPAYPFAHINLGLLELRLGDRAAALEHLDRAVALGPDLVYAQYNRGLLAESLGEPPAVRARFFRRAVELSQGHADGWYHLSLALDAAGDLPGAERAARTAVRLRGDWDDRFMLAYLLLKANNPRESEPLLVALKRERPGDSRVEQNLNHAHALMGR